MQHVVLLTSSFFSSVTQSFISLLLLRLPAGSFNVTVQVSLLVLSSFTLVAVGRG
jgi:hypothetical protein